MNGLNFLPEGSKTYMSCYLTCKSINYKRAEPQPGSWLSCIL